MHSVKIKECFCVLINMWWGDLLKVVGVGGEYRNPVECDIDYSVSGGVNSPISIPLILKIQFVYHLLCFPYLDGNTDL